MAFNCSALFTGQTLQLCEQLQLQLGEVEDTTAQLQTDTDDFFLLWASSLVVFMHAGFAMLSAGAIRTKNAKNILMSIVMDMTVCAIAWYLCGYAFAFGNDQGGFIGSSYWVGIDVGSNNGNIFSTFRLWLFEYAFAATSATIVSGAIAERARFDTYLLYSFYISFWVYPVVTHWVWGGGFLSLGNPNGKSLMGFGVVDFAGCGPVHMVGGLAGAIGAKIMGPRIGRFDPETGKAIPIPGHSSPLATLGTFILWVGWLGFNCGSVLILTGNGNFAARAGVNTILSSASAALSAMFCSRLVSSDGGYDLGMALNGALAGLVSITGCCPYVEMWAAIAIGFLGGLVYVGASRFTLNVLKIDDPLDATPVHLFCGAYGIIAGCWFAVPHLLLPLFPNNYGTDGASQAPAGIFYGGNTVIFYPNGTQVAGDVKGPLVAAAVVEICSIIAWVTVFITPFFLILQKIGVLRVAADIETQGLDVSHHGGGAYPDLFHAWNFQDAEKGPASQRSAKPAPPVAEPTAAPVAETTPQAAPVAEPSANGDGAVAKV